MEQNDLIEGIKKYSDQIGGFAGKYGQLVSSCDGVGTKILLAQLAGEKYNRSLSSIGIDCVAMVVNDLLCKGADPLFFLDYFAADHIKELEFKEVLAGMYDGCQQSGMVLLGGETAELKGIIIEGAFDICGFGVGWLSKTDELPRDDIVEGDVAIGLLSSGFHSNGFTLIREYATQEKYNDDLLEWLDRLLEPTKIYVRDIEIIQEVKVHIKALAHITGGGFNNVNRVLPDNLRLKYIQPDGFYSHTTLFDWIQSETWLTTEEMRSTFNCGVGMVMIIPKKDVKKMENTPLDWVFLGKVI